MSLLDLISAHNPWWGAPGERPKAPPRRRRVFERLRRALSEADLQRAQVLLGPRQVGKTCLLWQVAHHFLDQGWPPANVLYFDFKDDRYDRLHDLRAVLEVRPSGWRSDAPRLLLLDEITQAPRWDLALKNVVDHGRAEPAGLRDRILVTDSSASLMRVGYRESLQGRIDQVRIHGLTFAEALWIQGLASESERDVLLRSPDTFERYMATGGWPEHISAPDLNQAWERIRRDTTEGAIARDLSREGIDVERVTVLLRRLAQDSGALFHAGNRAHDLQQEGERGTDARTIRRWVALLEQACLIDRLTPWHTGLRRGAGKASRALKAMPKIYADDHGFIPAFSSLASPMSSEEIRARVHETAVFTHLRALREERGDFEVYYFREDEEVEVDFVLAFEDVVVGLEVTSRKSPQRKLAIAERLMRKAGLDRLVVVHGGPLAPQENERTATWSIEGFLLEPTHCLERSLEWARRSR
jgi:predicted AAA+ superfamily ATPase